MKEIDRRIKKGVRDISISPLFEKDKLYNIDEKSPLYYKEDPAGTMRPECNHCYITWQSKWIDLEKTPHWSNEAFVCNSIEDTHKIKSYLEKHLD